MSSLSSPAYELYAVHGGANTGFVLKLLDKGLISSNCCRIWIAYLLRWSCSFTILVILGNAVRPPTQCREGASSMHHWTVSRTSEHGQTYWSDNLRRKEPKGLSESFSPYSIPICPTRIRSTTAGLMAGDSMHPKPKCAA